MPELGHQARIFGGGERGYLREVCSCRKDERLAGDRDGCDLTRGGAGAQRVERFGQALEGSGTQGAGAGVIPTVIDGDERERAPRGERDVAHE